MTHDQRLRVFHEADLYVVITEDLCAGRTALKILQMTLAAGVRLVQLREKDLDSRPLYELAVAFRRETTAAGGGTTGASASPQSDVTPTSRSRGRVNLLGRPAIMAPLRAAYMPRRTPVTPYIVRSRAWESGCRTTGAPGNPRSAT